MSGNGGSNTTSNNNDENNNIVPDDSAINNNDHQDLGVMPEDVAAISRAVAVYAGVVGHDESTMTDEVADLQDRDMNANLSQHQNGYNYRIRQHTHDEQVNGSLAADIAGESQNGRNQFKVQSYADQIQMQSLEASLENINFLNGLQ